MNIRFSVVRYFPNYFCVIIENIHIFIRYSSGIHEALKVITTVESVLLSDRLIEILRSFQPIKSREIQIDLDWISIRATINGR